jgi:putative ABC transport system permease protein
MFGTVRSAMRSIDAVLNIAGLRTMDDRIEGSTRNERMIGVLALVFGGLATLLAGIGLYGVLACTTVQRTQEIGIRIGLGSTRLAIYGLVAKEMLRLGAIGLLVAAPCAVLLGHTLRRQRCGVSAAAPFHAGRSNLLMGMPAVLVPARRCRRWRRSEPNRKVVFMACTH